MPTKLVMPLLGEAVTDATVTKWLKNPGDKVDEFEPILEVNTDKVDTEIPSPTNGVILAALAKEGEVVKVGAVLGWIGQPGEAIPGAGAPEQPAAAVSPTASAPTPMAAQPAAPRDLGFISPVVAKIAAEQNVDLSQVPGTGMSGRITKKDIENYLQSRQGVPATAPSSAPAAIPERPAVQPPLTVQPGVAPVTVPIPSTSYTVATQTTMRKAIAEHMVMSKTVAPHVSTIMEVDMSCVIDHRTANKEAFSAQGVNLTFTTYFVAASVAGLRLIRW